MVQHCAITQELLIKIDFSGYQWFFNRTFQLNWVYGFVMLVVDDSPPPSQPLWGCYSLRWNPDPPSPPKLGSAFRDLSR